MRDESRSAPLNSAESNSAAANRSRLQADLPRLPDDEFIHRPRAAVLGEHQARAETGKMKDEG
jgi:hypothetical protein